MMHLLWLITWHKMCLLSIGLNSVSYPFYCLVRVYSALCDETRRCSSYSHWIPSLSLRVFYVQLQTNVHKTERLLDLRWRQWTMQIFSWVSDLVLDEHCFVLNCNPCTECHHIHTFGGPCGDVHLGHFKKTLIELNHCEYRMLVMLCL